MTKGTDPRPAGVIRRLHVAGVDIMLDRSGHPHLVEVNDRPVRLSVIRCGWLGGAGGLDAAAALAQSLVAASARATVAVVLPPAFTVAGGARCVRRPVRWHVVGECSHPDDLRVAASLADLTSFTNAAVSAGASVRVVTATEAARLPPGATVTTTAVWNRSQVSLPDSPLVVNDRWASALCVDKLATRQACAGNLRSVPAPTGGSPPALDLAGDPLLVLKPRFGSASRDVRRGRWRELREQLNASTGGQPFIVERWLDGATLTDAGQAFRFDLRVIVLGGTAVAAVVRRAAAPVTGRFDDSPLCWLTTTGPVLPVVRNAGPQPEVRAGVAHLPEQWLDSAATLAERAVGAIEKALDHPSDRPEPLVPDFRSLHQITGPLAPIPLSAEPLPD